MTKGTAIFLLGLTLLVVPSLGIPLLWKKVTYTVMGALLLGIGYSLRRAHYLATIERDEMTLQSETFVETTQHLFEVTR